MGRVKLKIKTLDSKASQQVTYSKRRCGILKKAKELSILCGVDIVLVMFSPTDKISAFVTKDRPLEDILDYYHQKIPPSDRLARRVELLEILKKVFQKLDHEVDVQSFFSCRSLEDKKGQRDKLNEELEDVKKQLSWWQTPDVMRDITQLEQMEESLKESLVQLQYRKEEIRKHPLNSMKFPYGAPSSLSAKAWLPSYHYQGLLLPEQPPSFAPSYNMKWASGPDMQACKAEYGLGQFSDGGCTMSGSLPAYSDLFGAAKQEGNGNNLLTEDLLDVFNGIPGMQQSSSFFQQELAEQVYIPGDDDLFGSDILSSFNEELLSEDFLLGDIPLVQFDLKGLDDDVSFQNWASSSCAAVLALDQQQTPQPSETPLMHPETEKQQSREEETGNGGDTEMACAEEQS